jgi:uncharacterized protein YeaO (DUF488 family)
VIKVRRVYDEKGGRDGFRILVDRIWPRGLPRGKVRPDLWLKDVAPSPELRKWFGHDPRKWPEFKRRYFGELDRSPEAVNIIVGKAREGDVVLLFGAKEERFNNAVALKEYLESRLSDR